MIMIIPDSCENELGSSSAKGLRQKATDGRRRQCVGGSIKQIKILHVLNHNGNKK